MNTLTNRARRLFRRIRQIQTEINSIDTSCRYIENDPDMSQELKNARIAARRKDYGTLSAQLRAMIDRSHEISAVFPTVEPAKRLHVVPLRVFSLPETNFPAAMPRRRDGKATRAWRAVQEAYAA